VGLFSFAEWRGYIGGMRPAWQFSMRRALISTTLVALGFSAFPVAFRTNIHTLPAHWQHPYRIIMLLVAFSLPMAAAGCLLKQTLGFFLAGAAFAMGLFILILMRVI
jgi:hypothetical protein